MIDPSSSEEESEEEQHHQTDESSRHAQHHPVHLPPAPPAHQYNQSESLSIPLNNEAPR